MTTDGNAVNSVKANSRKKGLKLTKEELSILYFDKGMDLVQIGKVYGVTASSILYWAKKLGIEYRRHLQEIVTFDSPVLSYILGVLHGDGFLYSGSGRKQIILSVTDKEFAYSFAAALNKIGINTFTIPIVAQPEGWKPQWKTVGESLRFHEFFHSMSSEERISKGMKYPLDFIRGVYESEGSVKYHKGSLEFAIYTTNKLLATIICDYLITTGYDVTIFNKILASGKDIFLVSIYKEFDIKKFMVNINPCIKFKPRSAYVDTEPSVVSNNNEGVESTKTIPSGW